MDPIKKMSSHLYHIKILFHLKKKKENTFHPK